jgi:hypothetical protein
VSDGWMTTTLGGGRSVQVAGPGDQSDGRQLVWRKPPAEPLPCRCQRPIPTLDAPVPALLPVRVVARLAALPQLAHVKVLRAGAAAVEAADGQPVGSPWAWMIAYTRSPERNRNL